MKKNVAVIFGGQSAEHDISIVTAIASVIKPLKLSANYTVIPVYIAKDGSWYSDKRLEDITLYSSGAVGNFCNANNRVSLALGDGLTLIKPGIKSKKIKIDIAFPAMHGTYGEDGSLMGLLRMAGIPFVGCDMPASVVAMDKVLAKQVTTANGIDTAKYTAFRKEEFVEDKDKVIQSSKKLKMPVFVKPAHLGSSIGISKVSKRDDLENAIEVALHYDDKALIEESIENLIEVTVPISGRGEALQVALIERPLAQEGDFFDFETKYLSSSGKKGSNKAQGAQGYSELPAQLDGDLYEKVSGIAKKVYSVAGCEGISRIDLLIDAKTKKIYFNEINPLPGSLYAHNWRQAGVSSIELVEELLRLANDSFLARKRLEHTFNTNFLQKSNI